MRQGEWPEQVIFTAEEVASILQQAAVSAGHPTPNSVIIESKDKNIVAFAFNARTKAFHAISTAQVTHWNNSIWRYK